jgi:hypothetical protein
MNFFHCRKPFAASARPVGAALLACLLALHVANVYAAVVADSRTQWSTTGTQGQNGWFNGYYNLTTDPTPGYSVGDLQTFLNDGTNVVSPTNHWNGGGYDLNPAASGPWTELGQETTHPNGTNSAPNQEHWTVRRWVSDRTAPVALNWDMRKQNVGGGDGVRGILYINGVQQDAATITGNDGIGVNRTWYANIHSGDVIDLALTPNANDGADGSIFGLKVNDTIPPNPTQPPVAVADSIADWTTTGTQGQNGWFYGYYDVRFDAPLNGGDGVYGAGDFQPFLRNGTNTLSPANNWDGSKFDLAANVAPWTELSSGGGHPAANGQGEQSVHWAIRRWVSDVSGQTQITGSFFNGGAGDGDVGRVFLNGVQVYSGLTDGLAAAFNLSLNLAVGDVLDFAADPNGSGTTDINLMNDGSDGFNFNVSVLGPGAPFVPIPEPSSVVMAALGGIGLLTLALRKRRC